MPSCAIITCKARSQKTNGVKGGVSYHLFPKDPETSRLWVRACTRGPSWAPTRTSTVCSKHFEPAQFLEMPNNRRILKRDAVPTVELPVISCYITKESAPDPEGYVSKEEVTRIMDNTARKIKEKAKEKNKVIHRLQSQILYLKKKVSNLNDAVKRGSQNEEPESTMKAITRKLISRCALKDKKINNLQSSCANLRKRVAVLQGRLRTSDGPRTGKEGFGSFADEDQNSVSSVQEASCSANADDGGANSPLFENESTPADRSPSPTPEELEDIVPDKREMFKLMQRLREANERVAQLASSNHLLENKVRVLEKKNKDMERNMQVLQKLNEGLVKRSSYLETRNERLRGRMKALGGGASDDEDSEDPGTDDPRWNTSPRTDDSEDDSDDDRGKRPRLHPQPQPFRDLLQIAYEDNIKVETVAPSTKSKKTQSTPKKIAIDPGEASGLSATLGEVPFDSRNRTEGSGGDPLSLIPEYEIKLEYIKIEGEEEYAIISGDI